MSSMLDQIGTPKILRMAWHATTTVPRSGGKDLRSSQAYPAEFGHRVSRLHVDHMKKAIGSDNRSHYCNIEEIVKRGYKDR